MEGAVPINLAEVLARVCPPVDFCSLRHVRTTQEFLLARNGVPQPRTFLVDDGIMVSVINEGGMGYGATSDVSEDGIFRACGEAMEWAQLSAGRSTVDPPVIPKASRSGVYRSQVETPWDSTSQRDKMDLLLDACERMRVDQTTDRFASLLRTDLDIEIVTSLGARIEQQLRRIVPAMSVTLSDRTRTATRSLGRASLQQGGLEVLDRLRFHEAPENLLENAQLILKADEAPTDTRDVVLGCGQMVLQIHESIGHPLELDRILGDERNYAGTSFVRPEDFGTLRYGSELLNVTFDPTVPEEVASYGFDDDGMPANREFLIREGVLERGLGGATSQVRLGIPGVSCARSSGWNRPPIDRMANLNLEPGSCSLEELIAGVDRGIFMDVNSSWSIDDSRRKFQFGCEVGRLIENGELTDYVRTPGYRGVTTEFWNSLDGVGAADTVEVHGTPNCGKGEPNQMNTAGHATPPCRFRSVSVFGRG